MLDSLNVERFQRIDTYANKIDRYSKAMLCLFSYACSRSYYDFNSVESKNANLAKNKAFQISGMIYANQGFIAETLGFIKKDLI